MLKATPTVGLVAVLSALCWPGFLYAAGAADASPASPRQVLERAVAAHGGEQNLAKLKSARRVVEGTFERESGADGEMRMEMVWQLPDRIRGVQTISLADRDREIRIVKVLSGEQGWFQVPARDGSGTRTIDLDGERLQTLKDEVHAIPLPNLTTYLDDNHTLSPLEPAQVNGTPADGVLVTSNDHGEMKLWFDRETGLLAKQEHRTRLISNQVETLQENIYGDYRDRNGVKYWHTVQSRLDGGDRAFKGKLATLELQPKLGEDAFTKPEE